MGPPRYLVACAGTTGDVHPFLHLARGLQALGREVVFLTHPVHAGLLQGSGLRFVPLGTAEEYDGLLRNPDLWHPQRAFAAILAGYRRPLLALDEAVRALAAEAPGPITLLAHPLVVPGAAMARERGLLARVVSVYLAPSSLRTCGHPMRLGELTVPRWVPQGPRRALWRLIERVWIDAAGVPEVDAARRTLGLPPMAGSLLDTMERGGDLLLTLFPAWFGPSMPDWPTPRLEADFPLFDAAAQAPLDPALQDFLATGEAPLVITAGTGNLHAQRFFDVALQAADRLGQRAIVLTRDRRQLPASLPPSVRWLPYVPLSALLPRSRLLVHHGGVGTTAEALRAGVPQFIAAFAWDQFDHGHRIQDLGVGRWASAHRLTPRRLTRALAALLADPAPREAAARVAATRFTQPPDAVALCQRLERALQA